MEHLLPKLVRRIADHNDVQAFQQFYDYFFDSLFAFALSYTKSRELAEEVVSDVFMKVWKNKQALTKVTNLNTYLYVAVKNQCYTYIKKHIKPHVELLTLENESLHFAIDHFTPEKAFLSEETRNALDDALQTLPSSCKAAFLLVKENNLSYKEAAEILDISPNTVKNHIITAMKKLRNYLIQEAKHEAARESRQRWLHIAKLTALILFVRLF